jgi:hypothetical protein
MKQLHAQQARALKPADGIHFSFGMNGGGADRRILQDRKRAARMIVPNEINLKRGVHAGTLATLNINMKTPIASAYYSTTVRN